MTDNLYEDLVTRYAGNFVAVIVPQEKIEKIRWLVYDIIQKKKNEEHHNIDYGHEAKRFFTGLLGEAAVEQLLGVDIIDWSAGDSAEYAHPDIKQLGIGIKTVERNKFPIIFKKNWYGQIICIRSDKRKDAVFVCGLATPEVLNRFQSDLLILSKNLYGRDVKTGFYGFHKLKRITKLEDIQ